MHFIYPKIWLVVVAPMLFLVTACSGSSGDTQKIGPHNDPWVTYDVAKNFIYGVDPRKYPDGQTVELPDGSYVYCQNSCFQYEGMSESIQESAEFNAPAESDPETEATVFKTFEVGGHEFIVRLIPDLSAAKRPPKPVFTPAPDISKEDMIDVLVWRALVDKVENLITVTEKLTHNGTGCNSSCQMKQYEATLGVAIFFEQDELDLEIGKGTPYHRVVHILNGVHNYLPTEMVKYLYEYWVDAIQYCYDIGTYAVAHREKAPAGKFN